MENTLEELQTIERESTCIKKKKQKETKKSKKNKKPKVTEDTPTVADETEYYGSSDSDTGVADVETCASQDAKKAKAKV